MRNYYVPNAYYVIRCIIIMSFKYAALSYAGNITIHKYAQLYRGIHSYIGLYTAIQGYTQLYTAIQGYTDIYRHIQTYAKLHRAIHSYTCT